MAFSRANAKAESIDREFKFAYHDPSLILTISKIELRFVNVVVDPLVQHHPPDPGPTTHESRPATA